MKNYLKGFAVFAIISVLATCVAVNTSAAKYVKNVVDCDFETTSGSFLAPGDYDGNGAIESDDHTSLKVLLLSLADDNTYATAFANNAESIYSDVNGDGVVDIRDLVLQNDNKSAELLSGGALVLNGNSAYSGELVSAMGTGAEYEISYTYTANTSVKVELGIENLLADSTETVTDEDTGAVTVKRSIKTPFTMENGNGIELKLIGEGNISDFSVTRVNMDNELADKENW